MPPANRIGSHRRVVGWRQPSCPPLLLRAASARGYANAILVILWIALAEAVPARAQAPPPPAPRTVLLIQSYNVGYEWTDELTRGVRAGLEGYGAPVDLSVSSSMPGGAARSCSPRCGR